MTTPLLLVDRDGTIIAEPEDHQVDALSKVRFLEGKGLITPERTPAGYRLFSDDQVERLRFVLTSQRDRFWPLKVIRERLDAHDRGLDVADDGAVVWKK